MHLVCIFFFFSSRRRHTRCSRDWSSDVCSSDLNFAGYGGGASASTLNNCILANNSALSDPDGYGGLGGGAEEIGRASCRGRGEISVVAGSLKKKKKRRCRGREHISKMNVY